ncbi:hypothetical protein [Prosthecobacter vanneervenii]|uniref:Uncharacterized protein n=1 Tax=Prosthecobacter vanneervenii TaxID=48466 RepID=A0A7W7YG53_9BACT|nr:hypothetical protein [Prosthecobacter vanneervenii]MBB5035557.1 hypothetical protein [Prosthecobacter vanneervenii]
MKTAIEKASMLELHSAATIDEKWKAAWSLLEADTASEFPVEFRWHARCWLTYRGIEGHIKHSDMMHRVIGLALNPPESTTLLSRWTTSQAAASFYYFTLNDMEAAAEEAAVFNNASHYVNHPPSILSALRVKCILAYAELLAGNYQKTQQIIEASLDSWTSTISNISWIKSPLYRLDMPAAATPIHTLMCIASRIGMCDKTEWQGQDCIIQPLKDPWVRCLKHLSRRKDSIWI